MRRGRYRFGPVQLTARFPLGIVERGLVCALPGEILVYPRLGRLSSRWMREHFLATDLVERRELRQGPSTTNSTASANSAGETIPGPSIGGTSARHNALMVREYHQSRDLNLDGSGRPVAAAARPRRSSASGWSWPPSVAATMCVSHMKQSRDSTLHVAIAGRQLVQWDGESRMANAGPLMDSFALAEGSPTPDVLARCSSRRPPSGCRASARCSITTRTDGSAEREPSCARLWRKSRGRQCLGQC